MIRLVTLEPFEPALVQKLARIIYQAYGLGCEFVGEVAVPSSARKGDALDAVELLAKVEQVRSFTDDKIVYLTRHPLANRALPSGSAPTPGYSTHGGERAVITVHGLPEGEDQVKRIAKQVVHEVGHLWELHHCLDPRCSMHPSWTPSFGSGEPVLCTFCREKSEQRIRLAAT